MEPKGDSGRSLMGAEGKGQAWGRCGLSPEELIFIKLLCWGNRNSLPKPYVVKAELGKTILKEKLKHPLA